MKLDNKLESYGWFGVAVPIKSSADSIIKNVTQNLNY